MVAAGLDGTKTLGATVGDGDCDGDCDGLGAWVGEVEVGGGEADGDVTEILGDGDRSGDCAGVAAAFADAVGQAVAEGFASGGRTAEGSVDPAFPGLAAAAGALAGVFIADTNWLGAGLAAAVG